MIQPKGMSSPGLHQSLVMKLRSPGYDAIKRIQAIDPSEADVRDFIAETLQHELGMAELFAVVAGDLFLETQGLGKFAYDHGIWRNDYKSRHALRACAMLVQHLSRTAPSQMHVEEAAMSLRKLLKRAMNGKVIPNVVNKFFNEQVVTIPHVNATDFDKDAALFATPSGVYDLRTLDRFDPRPEQLLTTMTTIAPDFNAKTPTWDSFLNDITNGDEELQVYLQRLMGYSLTGETREEVFHVLYGTGGNGKSTLLTVLHRIMGEHAGVGTPQLVSGRYGEGGRFELAGLVGKRAIMVFEGVNGHILDSARLKLITSGGTVVAESKYQDPFEFRNQVKVFLASNVRMPYGARDRGIERRFRVIPFTRYFGEPEENPNKEVDRKLSLELDAELPGILARTMIAARDWYQHGLTTSARVTLATKEYMSSSDTLGVFLEHCTVEEIGDSVGANLLHRVFTKYTHDQRIKPPNIKEFKLALEERGYHQKKRASGNVWMNLKLTPAGQGFARRAQGGGGEEAS